MSSPKLYTVQDIPGKDKSLVAATKITKGTRIISEPSILSIPRSASMTSKKSLATSLAKKVASLSEDKRQAFFSLHNAFKDEMTPELGVVRTNALPLGSGAATGGIFVEASRINHACVQNAQNTWNEDLQQLTIHAIRDIDEGEEITIMYLTERRDRVFRQKTLQYSFRFSCSCQLCSAVPPRLGASDKAFNEIQRLDEAIGDPSRIMYAPLQALHDVRKLVQLCAEQGIADASIPRAYYDAFQIAILHGDRARAKTFAERAMAARIILEGSDSTQVKRLKGLASDPAMHSSYNLNPTWKTSVHDIPSDASDEKFEAWLWKMPEDRIEAQRQYTDLRDEAMFPTFESLPWEFDVDLAYFDTDDGFSYRPCKHWCFLAEIVEVEEFLRLRLMVKDRAGQESIIAFHTDGRGTELRGGTPVKKGYTVAILYPHQHGFLDMTTGIRVEDATVVKVFPTSLKDLFGLSDKVQRYATATAGESICEACDKKATTLKKCARCCLFSYCDKSCQTMAWKEKGHKWECKLLADPDMVKLLGLSKEGFSEYITFSTDQF